MKRKSVQPDAGLDPEAALYHALLSLRSEAELRAFFRDLCTPAELEALADRWCVIPFLREGMPYREIHDHTGVSVTTIGRVARCLTQGSGGYRTAAERTLDGARPRKRRRASAAGARQ
jgi:TrpR-related protein YerC/YecD